MKHSRLEGRIAVGLDEFMLRLGHLTVLGRYLQAAGGSRDRVSRGLANHLTRGMKVRGANVEALGRYLLQKQLAGSVDRTGKSVSARKGARYAHLVCVLDENGRVENIVDSAGRPAEVWMQDYWIAERTMPSYVGAVTISVSRGAGKSGVSHLVDWGLAVGLTNSRLGLSAMGRAIVALCGDANAEQANPYLLGREKVAYLWLCFIADADVLTRVLLRLSGDDEWRKADAIKAIAAIGAEILTQARVDSGRLPVRTVKGAKEFAVEVGLDPQSLSEITESPSTAWHRVSSRLETLVDLGLVLKTLPTGYDGRHEYLYRVSDQGRRAVQLWQHAQSATDFLEMHAAELAFGYGRTNATSRDAAEALLAAYQMVSGPTGAQIDAVCVVASALVADSGAHLSIGTARERLVDAALSHPGEIALSRGYASARSESISIRGTAVTRMGCLLFE